MKTKVYSLIICLLALTASQQLSANTIKGNGKVSVKTVNVSDYNEIHISNSVEFEYEKSDAAPYLSVTIDENLFEYLDITVSGGKLNIGMKRGGGFTGFGINPTVFKIKSNSKDLKAISVSGSSKFIASTPLSTNSLSLNISGSGSVTFNSINVSSMSGNISGSGSIRLTGSAKSASYNISGSGSVKAYECQSESVSASMSGSGSMEVYASSQLDARCSGSGNIRYKGNPTINSKTSGSGSISSAR